MEGDHGRAQAVLNAIAARLDAALSLETVLEGPTIERLACHLRRRSERLNAEPLVALQPNGDNRPFFFVPGGDGSVFNQHNLARRMAPDQPLYGLQPRGIYGEQPPYNSVEDRAAGHIESIRAVQPRGPYLLGGHCIGAMIALEMALQLQRRGERVAVLAAFDAEAPALFRLRSSNLEQDVIRLYLIMARGFKAWLDREMPLEREALVACEPGQRAKHFMDLARSFDFYPPDAPDDRIDCVLDFCDRLCRSAYVPADVFSGTITYVRGRDSSFSESATGGWEEVTVRPLRTVEVPGDHVTLMTEPSVGILARELRAAIAEADIS